jgi:hypothetical protein
VAELGQRVGWIGSGRQRYLSFDCSHNNRDEAYALLEALTAALNAEQGQSRVLANFTEAYHEAALTQKWKDFYGQHDQKVERVACLGVGRTLRLAFQAYRLYVILSGGNLDVKMRFFLDEKAALDWLLGND